MQEEQQLAAVNAKRSRLQQLLGTASLPSPSELKAAVEGVLRERQADLTTKAGGLRDAQASAQVADSQVATLRSSLAQKTAEAAALRSDLSTKMAAAVAAGGSSEAAAAEGRAAQADSLLSAKRQKLDSAQKKASYLDASERVLGMYRQAVVRDHVCPTCARPFQGAEEAACLAHMDAEASKLPEMLSEQRSKLSKLQEQVDVLTSLQPAWLRLSDLEGRELPELSSRLAAAQQAAGAAAAHATQVEAEHSAMEAEVADAGRLLSDCVWPIDRLSRELADLRSSLASMEASAGGASFSAARTVGDVDADLEEAEAARSRHEAARDEVVRKQHRLRDEVLAVSVGHSAAKDELTAAMDRLSRVMETQSKCDALEASIAQMEEAVKRLAAEQAPLLGRRDALCGERDALRAAGAAADAEQEAGRRQVVSLQETFLSKLRLIQEYEIRGGGAELASCSAGLEELKARLDGLSAGVAAKEGELKARERQLVEHESTRREIEDVLAWRKAQGAVEEAVRQVAGLESRMAGMGSHTELHRRVAALSEERDELRRRQNMLRGALGTETKVAEDAGRELCAPQFKDIEPRHRRAQVEVRATEMANSDLDKYHKAVERALLAFHGTKMADINKVVKELWQKTYRGQDIDYIAIRADADGARSYNYRVVMVSNGAELEMRGRCSAGQKVLACLIIRLALAETFCLNCGILALDEPTTNLDVENSAGLAESLRAVMASRREQSNFQLIVITHDERFAQLIGTREHAEFMWRVTKDEAQHTHIAQELIDE